MEVIIDTASIQDMAKTYDGAGPMIKRELTRELTRLAIEVRNEAVTLAPVDTGRLRSSIAYELAPQGQDLIARIGTNVQYAKSVEFGTGLLSEAPDSKGGRHWPPPDALNGWALRHGFSVESGGSTVALGQIVAEIIGKRGGLRPKPYLRPAFNKVKPKVSDAMERARLRIFMKLAESK